MQNDGYVSGLIYNQSLIGEQIRKCREELGYSRLLLGYCVGIGKDKLEDIENGQTPARVMDLIAMCSDYRIITKPSKPEGSEDSNKVRNWRQLITSIDEKCPFMGEDNGVRLYKAALFNCDLSRLTEGHAEHRKAAADFRQLTGLDENSYDHLVSSHAQDEPYNLPSSAPIINSFLQSPSWGKIVTSIYNILEYKEMEHQIYSYSDELDELIARIRSDAATASPAIIERGMEMMYKEAAHKILLLAKAADHYDKTIPNNAAVISLMDRASDIPKEMITEDDDPAVQYAKIITDDIYKVKRIGRYISNEKHEASLAFGNMLNEIIGE